MSPDLVKKLEADLIRLEKQYQALCQRLACGINPAFTAYYMRVVRGSIALIERTLDSAAA